MSINIFWIPTDAKGRLGTMPRPNGGEWLDREMRDLVREQVDVLVSLLEGSEIWEFQLEGLADRCRSSRIRFHRFPIRDQHVPRSAQEFGTLTEQLARDVAAGQSVIVHCEHGISRSSMMAAGVLARLGVPVADALAVDWWNPGPDRTEVDSPNRMADGRYRRMARLACRNGRSL